MENQMKLLSIKCPSCTGITEIDQGQEQGFCQYCGTKLKIEKSGAELLIEKKETSSESDIRIAYLKEVEKQYFDEKKLFADVLVAYEDVELAGEGSADYWLARARFFAKGNLKEFGEGRVPAIHRKIVVDQYVLWMEKAIAGYSGNAVSLKIEKEKTIGEINNAFEGRGKKIEGDSLSEGSEAVKTVEKAEKIEQEAQRQTEALEDAEEAVLDLERGAKKKKKRLIIIASVAAVVLLLLVILLRSCGRSDEDDYRVDYYETFLELSNVLDLFDDEATRSDILDLDVDFGDEDTDGQMLRIMAPPAARLDRIVFHFDEDDLLTQVSISNAEYFNNFAASEGFATDLTRHIEANFANDVEGDGNVLSFTVDGLVVQLSLRLDRFNIDVSRVDGSGLTAEQQVVWDLIEARIDAGYRSWSELFQWASEQEITILIREGDEYPEAALLALINAHGLLGRYTHAAPGLGSRSNPDEVVLFLHFENLTYNYTVAELSALNRNSGSELNHWLDGSGRTRLESHFETVEILNLDEDGELITELPEVVEFVNWDIDFLDRFVPPGEGLIRINRVYRVIEIEEEDEEEEEPEEDEEDLPELGSPTTLFPGTWIVGEDISQGRYVITGDSSGNFILRRGTTLLVNEILGGGDFGVNSVTTYLLTGDEIEISSVNNVSFNLVTNRTLSRSLGAGNWVVGVDIEAGQFDATAPSGNGNLVVWRGNDLRTNEILGNDSLGVARVRVSLADGDIITISGLDRVNFE